MPERGWPGPGLICPECRIPPADWPLDAGLHCTNPACGAEYPEIVPGIPVVAAEAALARIEASDIPGPLAPDADLDAWLGTFAVGSAGFASVARAATVLKAAADSPLYGRLADLVPVLAADSEVIDLGCGVGAMTFEVARRSSARVTGLELDAHSLRWAARAASAAAFTRPGRPNAGAFVTHRARGAIDVAGRVRFVGGNLLDPPFGSATFELALLVNALDVVAHPAIALQQAVALVKTGGHVLFASPDAWNAAVTPRERWLGVDSPSWDAAFSAAGLETLVRIDDLEWRLEDTPRMQHVYRVHARLLRKL